MSKKDLQIYVRSYEFVLWLYPVLMKFPRAVKFTLAARIENTALNILTGVIQANAELSKTSTLAKVNVELEKLKTLIRLAMELNYLPFKKYGFALEHMDEIGRLLGGWLKATYDPGVGANVYLGPEITGRAK